MKKLNKILIISVLLGGFVLNLVSAIDDTDCGKFGSMAYKQENGQKGFIIVDNNRETDDPQKIFSNFLSVPQQQKILRKGDLNTAMLNLKKYCCEKGLGGLSKDLRTCYDDRTFFNPNALDSPYLFDHIFDIMVRRVNGLTGDKNIYTKTDMSVDEKGLKWREFINGKAENSDGSDAQSIINMYKDYRKKSDPRLGYDIADEVNGTFNLDNQSFLMYVSGRLGGEKLEESKKVAEAIKNYENWTLYDRYRNMCALSMYFYSLLDNGGSNNNDRNRIIFALSDGSCKDKIQMQIDGEEKYVQLVMQRSSNLFMENYIKGYFSYLYDRGNKLKALWKKSTNRWLDVIRETPELLENCTKG